LISKDSPPSFKLQVPQHPDLLRQALMLTFAERRFCQEKLT